MSKTKEGEYVTAKPPCPFCGGTDVIIEKYEDVYYGRPLEFILYHKCDHGVEVIIEGESKEELVAKWKKRASRASEDALDKLNETSDRHRSVCCEALVKAEGRATKWYLCTNCDRPCNVNIVRED